MKTRWFTAALALVLAVSLSPDFAEAKRLGGGKNTGMQRQAPAQQATPQTPPPQTPAAPAAAAAPAGVPAGAAAAAAAPAKRSWMGPIAGLAAGLGLAALFSYLGMGEGFANFMMLLLLGIVAFIAIRFIMSRMRGGAQPALAGASAGGAAGGASQSSPAWQRETAQPASAEPLRFDRQPAATETSVTGAPLRPIQIGEALGSPAAMAAGAPTGPLDLPAGFDLPAFERVAKMIFIRLQAANDKADLDDLRQFTTPEMFAAVRLDLQDRGSADQHTDVQRVDAELIDFSQEETRQVASVRFKGLIVEEQGGAPSAFDEIWHLVKPVDGQGTWAIAGIQQPQ